MKFLSAPLMALAVAIALAACGGPSNTVVEPVPDDEEAAESVEAGSAEAASEAQASDESEAAETAPEALPPSTVEQIPAAPDPAPAPPGGNEAAAAPAVGTFTTDELFAAGGGGCGMSLWKPGSSGWDDGIVFFHGLGDAPALMKLDGTLMQLNRTAATGEEFYGQNTSQTFVSVDNATTVTVDVTLGEPGEIESVGIAGGQLRLEQNGEVMDVAVIGDAGC